MDEQTSVADASVPAVSAIIEDEQSSWNPALRPDTHHEVHNTAAEDDFFDRYSSEPNSQSVDMSERDEIQSADAAVDAGLAADQHSDEADATARETAPEEEPAAHYEHQGDITAIEEAIDESVEAPLIRDAEPVPTISTITREGTFASEAEDAEVKNVVRSFTTNFTEVPEISSTLPEAVKLSSDWPAVGDDKTFADLLDGEADKETEAQPAPLEEDLSAAWAAALDDDEVLDDSNDLDPTTFFGDDDDGFLLDDDEPEQTSAPVTRPAISQQRTTSSYVPANAGSIAPSPFINSNHGRSTETPSTGLYDVYSQQQPPATQARPVLSSAESFVNKPRGQYQSPYDLPMEVVKTRRRPPSSQHSAQLPPVAPPRTSSFGMETQAVPSPPSSSHGLPNGKAPTASARSTPNVDAGFFADLPPSTKPRARPSNTYSPSLTGMPTPPLTSSHPHFPPANAQTMPPPPRPSSAYAPPVQTPTMIDGFRQPEKAPLFPEQTTPPSTMQSQMTPNLTSVPSQASNRYSPAPQSVPSPSRYSPAPPNQPKNTQRYSSSPGAIPSLPPSRSSQSFIPRTSSPLAVHGRPQQQPDLTTDQLRSMSGILPGSPGKSFDAFADRRGSSTTKYAPSNASSGFDAMSQESAASPQRQRTQSPAEFRKQSVQARPVQTTAIRPAQTQQSPMRLSHKRQFSRDLPYAAPSNEQAGDMLQRWRGHPIFHWNEAGMVVSSIPKHTPFYASGTSGPTIRCTPGDVKLATANTIMPTDDSDAKFPGPLPARSKGKKKDLLSWMATKIESLQSSADAATLDFNLTEDERLCRAEKVLLWQMMRLYLENDGVLEGSPKIQAAVRQLLIPDLAQKGQVMELQSPTANNAYAEVVDTTAIYQIRQALFEGDRERAVMLAEERKLWGHAMLIASTINPESFKQIVSSFVRNQVKSQGSELKSLSALYQTFAGNPEDCVDELVPPSARAGFQMISTTDGRGPVDTLSGLNQWRETLSLMHSNPAPGNAASLLAVGKLLAGYDRIEAAHTCFLFARNLAKHSGADDAESSFVLLGADPVKGHVDVDSLMLTEIYEYASSLTAPSTAVHYIPHLQAYKLVHAQHLAASGQKAQAQAYCEHIDAAIRSTTRPSGYYHPSFAQELMSFNAMLAQTVHSGNGGKFFSRPSIDKVSSGMGSWFSKFVSGDEGDTDSNASGPGVVETEGLGPFGGLSGGSTVVSRNASVVDLQSHAMHAAVPTMQQFQPSSSPSRYAPLGQGAMSKYAPSSQYGSFDDRSVSAEFAAPMPSSEPIRSASSRYAPLSGGQSPALLGVKPAVISRQPSNQSLASTGSYEPKPLLAEQDGFGYASPPINTVFEDTSAPLQEEAPVAEMPETAYEQPDPENGSSYVPPSMGYEPPSFQPWQPEPGAEGDSVEDAPKPKKKSFMDDDYDDDIMSRAAALKPPPASPSASRDADPAVLAAIAAETAKDAKGHSSRDSGSWFGGWFGKKDPNAPAGPVKAKLGEQNSFYFDKELNKWVNGKAGAGEAAAAAAPTPPPPRAMGTPVGGASGPPSRVPSGNAPPMSGPPSRQGTPANGPPVGLGLPPKSVPSAAAPGSMLPPPRPASGMSNASSLDDLLGPPSKRAGGAKTKKKGRYVDVMANAG